MIKKISPKLKIFIIFEVKLRNRIRHCKNDLTRTCLHFWMSAIFEAITLVAGHQERMYAHRFGVNLTLLHAG